jgi:hypothetical protein
MRVVTRYYHDYAEKVRTQLLSLRQLGGNGSDPVRC